MAITRRGFVAGASAALAAGALGASAAFAQVVDPAEITWDHETDVVVLGCGSGGSPAIIDAYDAGNEVLIVEKASWLGGTMRRSGGGIAAAGTCVQKALGVEDNVEDFYNYLVDCGEGLADAEMLRVFADRAAADFDWYVQDIAGQTEKDWHFVEPLEGVGLIEGHEDGENGLNIAMRPGLNLGGTPVFFDYYGYKPVPRCYWFEPNPEDVDDGTRIYAVPGLLGRPDVDTGCGGTGLWKPMQDAIDARDIPVLYRTTLVSLVKNVCGEVIGAKCLDLETEATVYIKARKGVIIATGEWQNNDQMLFDYCLYGWKDEEPAVSSDPGAHTLSVTMAKTTWATPEQADGAGILAGIGAGAATCVMAAGPWKGGLKTDVHAQVLDVEGNPIPRLYASSYAVGGKQGKNYPHCGLHNMWNMTFGRIAAENVSALEPWC